MPIDWLLIAVLILVFSLILVPMFLVPASPPAQPRG